MISNMGLGQERDSTLRFFGNLYDSENYKPVGYAHIINLNGNNATISDSLGTFNLRISKGDSLMITSIGYETNYYQYTGEGRGVVFESIPMKGKAYAISEVKITPWGTYRDFKRRFMELEMENPEEKVHPLLWEGITREPTVEEDLNPGISSPITMIYNLFSDEAKARRKLKEIKDKETREKLLRSKYNREQVSALTGLEGETLERFMNYCNFSEEYILQTREYFILERVKKCYQRFMRLDSLNNLYQER